MRRYTTLLFAGYFEMKSTFVSLKLVDGILKI